MTITPSTHHSTTATEPSSSPPSSSLTLTSKATASMEAATASREEFKVEAAAPTPPLLLLSTKTPIDLAKVFQLIPSKELMVAVIKDVLHEFETLTNKLQEATERNDVTQASVALRHMVDGALQIAAPQVHESALLVQQHLKTRQRAPTEEMNKLMQAIKEMVAFARLLIASSCEESSNEPCVADDDEEEED